MKKKITVASMFAGIGGIDLAFEQAGFSVVWANDIDKYACRTYRMNFGEEYLVEGDIQDVKTEDIPDFEVLIAGFPCQAFSSVGLEKGFEDPRGNLFFETARVIAAKNPQVVFFENVANLVKHDEGRTFLTIFNTLAELGYCVKYKVMNASDYGIPQQRNRIYIVAFKDESLCDKFVFPEERPLEIDAFALFDKERQPGSYYMDNHRMWKDMVAFMTDKHRIYRFTDWGLSRGRDGICPTLLAAMGSPYERIPFFYDDYSIRKITQREAARLQGFPEGFQFPIDKTPKQVYKQIGNSVCVPLVKEIADGIMKVMEEEELVTSRDRASGWKHAKRSGHKNEDLVRDLLDSDSEYAADFVRRIGVSDKEFDRAEDGGLHEKSVEGVLGRKSKPKTDVRVFYKDGSFSNISVKKSEAGQVYFVRDEVFVRTYEAHFGKKIPENVKRAISLFWASAPDAIEIIEEYADRSNQFDYDMQIRHKSLNAETLKAYDEVLYNDMLQWFKDNAYEIAFLCFASGATKHRKDWAEFVWYKNLLGENDRDDVIAIVDICEGSRNAAEETVCYGREHGGTTIQMPFGFLQWHQKQLQFHHQYLKVISILKDE